MGVEDLAIKVLQGVSGTSVVRNSKYAIFNKIIGFKGVLEGVGCSTIVSEVAIELAKRGLNVCVIDTSILNPAQFTLLRAEKNEENSRDWFDLGIGDDTGKILKSSSIANNIAVLGFENRDINDLLSTFDCEELVTVAFRTLETLYDIVLVDICSESTNVATTAAIHAHTVVQVWSDDLLVMNGIDNFIKNMSFKCCPVDKMKNVIINKNIINSESDCLETLKQYNFKMIARLPFSLEYYKKSCSGVRLNSIMSRNKEILSMYNEICKTVDFVAPIHERATGSINGMDIVNGKVEGTVSKKYKDWSDEVQDIVNKDSEKSKEELGLKLNNAENKKSEDTKKMKKSIFKRIRG